MLDLLEILLGPSGLRLPFVRLDGSTAVAERQQLLDKYGEVHLVIRRSALGHSAKCTWSFGEVHLVIRRSALGHSARCHL